VTEPTEAIDAPDTLGQVVDALNASEGHPSTAKVRALANHMLAVAGQSEQGAQLVSILEVAKTVGVDPAAYLPTDPAELDALLERGAALFLAARSDDAEPRWVAPAA
jgi:hypothetical protein